MLKLVVFVAAALALATANPVEEPGWRIVGGSSASQGQFPYIVSLRINNQHACGGSIINNLWILTAAHCIVGQSASRFTVVAGTNTLNAGGQRYGVARLFQHESYNSNTMIADIALMKLSSPIQFNNYVRAIPLATSTIGGGQTAILCGWGTTSYPNGQTPNNLQMISFRTVTTQECASALKPNPIYESQVCTFVARGKGACHGDSGGPLADGSGRQIGVVSWGRPCAIGYPDVFTRVSSFTTWISQKMNSN